MANPFHEDPFELFKDDEDESSDESDAGPSSSSSLSLFSQALETYNRNLGDIQALNKEANQHLLEITFSLNMYLHHDHVKQQKEKLIKENRNSFDKAIRMFTENEIIRQKFEVLLKKHPSKPIDINSLLRIEHRRHRHNHVIMCNNAFYEKLFGSPKPEVENPVWNQSPERGQGQGYGHGKGQGQAQYPYPVWSLEDNDDNGQNEDRNRMQLIQTRNNLGEQSLASFETSVENQLEIQNPFELLNPFQNRAEDEHLNQNQSQNPFQHLNIFQNRFEVQNPFVILDESQNLSRSETGGGDDEEDKAKGNTEMVNQDQNQRQKTTDDEKPFGIQNETVDTNEPEIEVPVKVTVTPERGQSNGSTNTSPRQCKGQNQNEGQYKEGQNPVQGKA